MMCLLVLLQGCSTGSGKRVCEGGRARREHEQRSDGESDTAEREKQLRNEHPRTVLGDCVRTGIFVRHELAYPFA